MVVRHAQAKQSPEQINTTISRQAVQVPVGDLSGIKKYICEKFGDDCYLALLVVHAENGTLQCDRIGVQNKNGTVDRGLWQLNSAYHEFEPDCFKNTDKAYAIYLSRGKSFDRWSAYKNGSYKRFIGKI